MADQFIGANVGELNNLANNLDQTQAGTIDQVIQAVQGMIDGLDGVWRGNDATQFAGEWQATHRVALQAAADALRKAAGDARRNAEAQNTTSSGM